MYQISLYLMKAGFRGPQMTFRYIPMGVWRGGARECVDSLKGEDGEIREALWYKQRRYPGILVFLICSKLSLEYEWMVFSCSGITWV